MRDLRDRLHDVDIVEPPDVWTQALRRAPSPQPPDRQPYAGRLVTIVVAAAIAIAGGALVVRSFRSATAPSTPSTPTIAPTPSALPSRPVYLKTAPDLILDTTIDIGPVLFGGQEGEGLEIIATGRSAAFTVPTGTRVMVGGTAESIAWGWGPGTDPYDAPVALSRPIPIVVHGADDEHLLLRLQATWADGTTGEWRLAFTVSVPPRDQLSLACPADQRLRFDRSGPVLTPGSDLFIRANLPGVRRDDAVAQVTWPQGSGWDGTWVIYRKGALIAFVRYDDLSGVACAGTRVGGV
jgi:hypothetical protein